VITQESDGSPQTSGPRSAPSSRRVDTSSRCRDPLARRPHRRAARGTAQSRSDPAGHPHDQRSPWNSPRRATHDYSCLLGLRAPTRRLGVGASMSVERRMRAWKPTSSRGSQAPRGDGRRVRRRRLPRSESRENESWPGAADSCAPHRSMWRGLRVATGEENSTIPPSLRVVKGFEREAVVVAVHGS
jgi:hypothetical protein